MDVNQDYDEIVATTEDLLRKLKEHHVEIGASILALETRIKNIRTLWNIGIKVNFTFRNEELSFLFNKYFHEVNEMIVLTEEIDDNFDWLCSMDDELLDLKNIATEVFESVEGQEMKEPPNEHDLSMDEALEVIAAELAQEFEEIP